MKKDLTGQRFGKLVAIEPCGRKNQCVLWRCKCDCGKETKVKSNALLSGNSKSCGCGRIEAITTHNKTGTRLFNVWRSIRVRCNTPKSVHYKFYGGRGIKVCDEWNDSYEAFEKWALENGYREAEHGKYTLDRIDVNGNYEPSNCRWVSMKEQGRNRRTNVFLEYKGERHCLAEWAEKLGIKYNTLGWRYRQGWSVEEVLFGRA